MLKKLWVWGAGDIGKRIVNHLDDGWEIGFVDSNRQLPTSFSHQKKIISVDEYLKAYSDEFILIAHLQEEESIRILCENHIPNYFIHCDLPGEFKEPYARNNLEKYIISYLGTRKNYVLYGLNLYSIIIDYWLRREYGIHPYILVQEDISEELVDKIKNQYTELALLEGIEQLENIEEVCVCSGNYTTVNKSNIFSKYSLIDIFDCSDKIDSYHNSLIETFRNIHEGKRCFVVATGPSLKMEDLDMLENKKEICFSVNQIFRVFDKTNWKPDYYVMDDYREVNNNKTIVDSWTGIKGKFVGDTSEEFWKIKHKEDVYQFHKSYEYYMNRLPKFSDDFSRKSYTGLTVTYTCIQLAVYMGFQEIYLLGVDCNYKKNSRNNYFFAEKQKDTMNHHEDNMFIAYRAAEEYAKSHGIKIYNATRGGMLEVFERVDFDLLFHNS